MFAVINLGLKSIRLCLLDADARTLFKKSYPIHSVIFGEAVEQDGEEWWRLTCQLFHDAASAGLPTGRIEAVTVSASSSCLVCVGEDGRVLRPVIMVNDRRHESVGTGAQPVMIRRIRWLAEAEPECHRQAALFLSPNDFLVHRMTGAAVTDPVNATKFGPVGSQAAGDDAADGLRRRLPEVREVGARVGVIQPAVARSLGLAESVEVRLSSYDAVVSVVGSGALDDGDLCDVSGTVTSIRLVSMRGGAHPTGAVATQAMPLLGGHLVGGSTNLGGGLIEWLKTTFYPPQGPVYEQIDADVQSLRPEQCALIFLPHLLGERAPLWDPQARGVFFGIERTHGRKHFARAVVEGAAFLGRSLVDEIVAVHGAPPTRVRVSGGLSRIAAVNQIKADVYARPVEVVAEFESTVMGAFLLAFHERLGAGRPLREFCRERVRVREILLPDPAAVSVYQKKYRIYRELYGALKPHFGSLREVQGMGWKSEDAVLENL